MASLPLSSERLSTRTGSSVDRAGESPRILFFVLSADAVDSQPRKRPPSRGSTSRRRSAAEVLTLHRIAAERGIDFTPVPDTVTTVLPELVDSVEQHAAG